MTIALPTPMERSFTPAESPANLDVIEPVYEALLAMGTEDEAGMQTFLERWNETNAWVADYITKSRVAVSIHTDDEEAAERWGQIVQFVMPALSGYGDKLNRKFLESPVASSFETGHWAPFVREVRAEVELFREENIDLERREAELTNEYQQISGGWTIEFDGAIRTMAAMRRYDMSSDREVRKAAYEAKAELLASTSEALEELFDELFEVRKKIAANAGFPSYREYVFAQKLRDYGPEACDEYARLVEQEVTPLLTDIAKWKTEALGLDTYRPWDGAADPRGGEPLRPFEDVDQLKDGVERMMRRLDPELGEMFASIRTNMDLASRPNKRQGGFMTWYSWDRRPFIFANAAGNQDDIVTLLHEAGHAFHGLMSVDARPMAGVSVPTEFNEVASMAQELLHYRTLDEFYDEADRERAIREHLMRIPSLLASVALGDAFQQWLYTHPDHTRAERRAKWVELTERFYPDTDYSGIPIETRENGYHRILHFFIVPFYFIEYGFAQLGSLQIALAAEKDLAGAMKAYKEALALGPQRDVEGLYEAAGAKFVPTAESLREMMEWIRAQIFRD